MRIDELRQYLAIGAVLLISAGAGAAPEEKGRQVPDALKPWTPWALWNDGDRDCPTSYQDAKKRVCAWPSRLQLQANRTGSRFDFGVTVFRETWVALPGSVEIWPKGVKANGAPLAVIEHGGSPAVRLVPGYTRIEGTFEWSDMPQRIALPREIGILSLTVNDAPAENPVWDADGFLWLKRDGSSEGADKNFLSVKLYAALEDGIPLWLRTEVELTVSGKSREEDIGAVLPDGWKLASVQAPIPVAVDEFGGMKAQVRAGKWTVQIDAFRLDNPKELHFGKHARAAATDELLAFRSRPELRMVEIGGAPAIDISQTTFPDKWRELPVYRWDTAAAIHIEERMRGMGEQKPAGLTVARDWWLDEGGGGFTFRDTISGQTQQIWRLDAAEGQKLGSVRSAGRGQLITLNPKNGAAGIEIRSRNLNLEATGRSGSVRSLSASGWKADVDALTVTLNLPPGWRLFALFGADWVKGDWLTSWTLLDLFLLLIFTLAVFRLWGLVPAVLAFAAFGLSFHEAGAPRYTWLILLVPIALQRVAPAGWAQRWLAVAKWLAVALLVLVLVPFVARQVQQALYPQLELERGGSVAAAVLGFTEITASDPSTGVPGLEASPPESNASSFSLGRGKSASNENMSYDAKARIQTGPGVPEWSWRTVRFGWNGPVQAAQQVRPVLISLWQERFLTVSRVVLLLILAAIVLGARRIRWRHVRPASRAAATVVTLLLCTAGVARAQSAIPDQATLDALRARLLETSDAYPTAADIASVTLKLAGRKVSIDAEIHAAVRTSVPIPGRLPAWSPISVFLDDRPAPALRREAGNLWIVAPEGVHRVHVDGMLPNVTEWEWTFLLKPRQVKIDAPGWTFSGLRADGVPEQQVFFALKKKAEPGQATYDRQDVQSVAEIDRTIEMGLVWQVHSKAKRLSPRGKAVALRIPLLPGENVLTANAVVKDGFIEIRLGAQDAAFEWESGLAVTNHLKLATHAGDVWVERWHLVASPVWNVAIAGTAPAFEQGSEDLIPVWQPWPGEEVNLSMSRPEAIPGATVTVSSGIHEITLGQRQRISKLDLSLRSSLGEDFLIAIPAGAEVTALQEDGKPLPVRKDGAKLLVPLHPGEETVSVAWKSDSPLGFRAEAEAVRLPVESANIHTVINVPEDRWVLLAEGPLRGPAVRFWGILICSLLAALALSWIPRSPLRTVEWMLLVVGLTQVSLPSALAVIAWLFLLAWRGGSGPAQRLSPVRFDLLQIFLVLLTMAVICILLAAVWEGLLGSPEMFIQGNGSTRSVLRWFQARSEGLLPRPECFSISIWWYRFLMLLWALWLAAALIRWLRSGWVSFSAGGCWKTRARKPVAAAQAAAAAPPPLPGA